MRVEPWINGFDEARRRLHEHLENPSLRFDARDRSALAFVLKRFDDRIKALRDAIAKPCDHIAADGVSDPSCGCCTSDLEAAIAADDKAAK